MRLGPATEQVRENLLHNDRSHFTDHTNKHVPSSNNFRTASDPLEKYRDVNGKVQKIFVHYKYDVRCPS